ncbi:TetR/AcrR family transcriptional regulator [Neorhizobium galegae]|uniref:TetR/AcrR family transcriptional regulator n=1 Tax=Neorhizobium galegae TaxID=399 RepID=UPI0021067F33|nr:TetR/AcrR family transcriptional regulator [Neorhizobium galegae]UIY29364.1 TetR/AcrR family transcriptional regulator [Neorhizobium galegae]
MKKTERVNQKKRTRAELLRTARQLIEAGGHPSVAEVADAAGISRATAYRYFSTPDEMVHEAVLDAVADGVRLPDSIAVSGTVEERLDEIVGQIFRMVAANESVFRTFLATSITSDTQLRRGGRRIPWLTEALEPLRLRLAKDVFDRLLYGLSMLTGIESLVVLRDICDVDPQEGERIVRWSAQAMLAKALAEETSTGRK